MLLYYDVIDGDVNKFDEEANESHDSKANGCSKSDLLKFCKQNEKISFTKAVLSNFLAHSFGTIPE